MYKIWVQHKTQKEFFAYLGYSSEDPLKEKIYKVLQLKLDFSEEITTSMDKYVMGDYLEESELAELEFTLNAAFSNLPEKSELRANEVGFQSSQ